LGKIFHPRIWREQLESAALYWLVIPAAVIGAGAAADSLLRLPPIPGGAFCRLLGGILVSIGVLVISKATRDLTGVGQGTPSPFRPPRRLVTSGAYRFCRHPMFLGYDVAALGVALILRSTGMVVFSLPLFFWIEIRFLKQEERILSSRFKTSYDTYKASTPMLIPSTGFWRQGRREKESNRP